MTYATGEKFRVENARNIGTLGLSKKSARLSMVRAEHLLKHFKMISSRLKTFFRNHLEVL